MILTANLNNQDSSLVVWLSFVVLDVEQVADLVAEYIGPPSSFSLTENFLIELLLSVDQFLQANMAPLVLRACFSL